MATIKKGLKPTVTQTLSKEMKQVVEGMIQKALKPSHKQLSALEQKLKTLKMDQGAPKKAKAKKAIKVAVKAKAPAKATSTKSKMKKALLPKAA